MAVEEGQATLGLHTDPALHGNQQGTIHGWLLSELADAAIVTTHSTLLLDGESFASIDLKINFLRPVWQDDLRAVALVIQRGKTISHYRCEIFRGDDKLVAIAVSAVMTLQGSKAQGALGVLAGFFGWLLVNFL